jgi:hypothetical protein
MLSCLAGWHNSLRLSVTQATLVSIDLGLNPRTEPYMPPITPQVILAKKAVETAHDLYKDHHSASSNAQAQLYEGMLPKLPMNSKRVRHTALP